MNYLVFELIWEVYCDIGYFDYVGGMFGGKQCQVNLCVLYDWVCLYEVMVFCGLFCFLWFIEWMQECGDDLGMVWVFSEQEDVVWLMMIYSSKGFEFFVVFIVGFGRSFNMMDFNKLYLFDKEFGFGMKYIYLEFRISYLILLFVVMKKKMCREFLLEELCVLYVVLIRVKEKLFFVGFCKNWEKQLVKWQV